MINVHNIAVSFQVKVPEISMKKNIKKPSRTMLKTSLANSMELEYFVLTIKTFHTIHYLYVSSSDKYPLFTECAAE